MALINFSCPKCGTKSVVDAEGGSVVCPVCMTKFVRKAQPPVTQQPVQIQPYNPYTQPQQNPYNAPAQQNPYNAPAQQNPYSGYTQPQQTYSREQVYPTPTSTHTFDNSTFWGRFANRYLQSWIAGGFVVLFACLLFMPFLVIGAWGLMGHIEFGFNVMLFSETLRSSANTLIIISALFYYAALVLLVWLFVKFIKDYKTMQFGRSTKDFVLVCSLWGCFFMIFIMALAVKGKVMPVAITGLTVSTYMWLPLLLALEPLLLILIFRFLPARKQGGYSSGYSYTSPSGKQESGFVRGVKKFWNNKKLRYIAIGVVVLIVAAIILFSVLGKTKLEGRWKSEDMGFGTTLEIEFSGNEYTWSGTSFGITIPISTGTFEVDGDKLILYPTGGGEETHTYKLEGNTLYIDGIAYTKT